MVYKKGHKHSKEVLIKMRNAKLGKKFSEEHKQKLRETKLKNPTNYWLGKKRPEMSGEMQKDQIEEDCIRTRELLDSGYKLIRLWESTINDLNIIGFETLINTKINEEYIINGI